MRVGKRAAFFASLTVLGLALGGTAGAAERAQPRAGGKCDQLLPDVYDRVSPGVVSIAATSVNPYRLRDRVSHVVGTGTIIDPAGLVLTNSHVVFGRQSIQVTLADGTALPAEVVGADPIFDIAVVRVPVPRGAKLLTLPLGDSDAIRVGEDAMAIGNPLGLDQTLTRGVVSAMNRVLPETPFSLMAPLIQVDTPINPGNSGGPLLNRCGEVIGVTSSIIAEADRIGFAIPINLVKAALPSLLERGRVLRPWLGFHGQIVPESLRLFLRAPLVEGLLVEAIEPGSPAASMGLQGGRLEVVIGEDEFLLGGDIVTQINGISVGQPEALERVMRGLRIGARVVLTVFRDGQDREVTYELPERPLQAVDLPERRMTAGQVPPVARGVRAGQPGRAGGAGPGALSR
jgi:S1-C subfamily serine protease